VPIRIAYLHNPQRHGIGFRAGQQLQTR
jgi:hypothetical protein